MASGYIVLLIIFLLFILTMIISIVCYCGGQGQAGRYFGSNENIAAIVYSKGIPLGGKKKCKCSNKFKGICKDCEGVDFVDDGAEGKGPDFSGFGGDDGLDGGANGNANPISAFLRDPKKNDGDGGGGGDGGGDYGGGGYGGYD